MHRLTTHETQQQAAWVWLVVRIVRYHLPSRNRRSNVRFTRGTSRRLQSPAWSYALRAPVWDFCSLRLGDASVNEGSCTANYTISAILLVAGPHVDGHVVTNYVARISLVPLRERGGWRCPPDWRIHVAAPIRHSRVFPRWQPRHNCRGEGKAREHYGLGHAAAAKSDGS